MATTRKQTDKPPQTATSQPMAKPEQEVPQRQNSVEWMDLKTALAKILEQWVKMPLAITAIAAAATGFLLAEIIIYGVTLKFQSALHIVCQTAVTACSTFAKGMLVLALTSRVFSMEVHEHREAVVEATRSHRQNALERKSIGVAISSGNTSTDQGKARVASYVYLTQRAKNRARHVQQ